MIDDELINAVQEIVREVATEEVMPRWQQLAAHEIEQKASEHDMVTIADRRAEEELEARLTRLLPGSLVVGEEGVTDSPAAYERLLGEAPVWIVDPIDGTREFVHGRRGFATLVTLAQRGESLVSWTYAPALGLLAVARAGGGSQLNGEPLRLGVPAADRTLTVATSHPDFSTAEQQRVLSALNTEGVAPRPCGAAGLEYLAIARGELDAVAFSWENAWDHAAGLLLVAEAGGTNATLTGEPFRIEGGNALPFTAARDERTVRRILGLLATGAPGTVV